MQENNVLFSIYSKELHLIKLLKLLTLTGMEKVSARYFKMVASFRRSLVLSTMLPLTRLSNSFLISEAMESITTSFTFNLIMSASRFSSL